MQGLVEHRKTWAFALSELGAMKGSRKGRDTADSGSCGRNRPEVDDEQLEPWGAAALRKSRWCLELESRWRVMIVGDVEEFGV